MGSDAAGTDAAADVLPGGLITTVVRVGDTVRRTMPDSAPFVHQLLRHLERAGWSHAPRALGCDDQGGEVLTFIDGEVPWQPERQVAVRTDNSLIVSPS